MKLLKWFLFTLIALALLLVPLPMMAETAPAEQVQGLADQLTLQDISALNKGQEKVYSHNGRVTLVDGTCSPLPIKDAEDAAQVVSAMRDLIGANADTEFAPWREITDPLGNKYFIFQQMYAHTTVCGGAVKVITDPDGNMLALSSSVESKMPDITPTESITAEEAEKIALDKGRETPDVALELYSQYTGQVILPSVWKFDLESTDESSQFVWVVYTSNPTGSLHHGSDLPYLAHYVSMSGSYLYSIPAIVPDDQAGRSGYDASYMFEFMEPAEYTGYVDLSDGTEKEITVTVMRDRRTGMYYLGNIERRIVVADCYSFLYKDGQVSLEYSPDNREWDQVGLLSLYNYCRAYDYYSAIGWNGGDGEKTPILILNRFCDDHMNGIDNACYIGKVYGMQCFAASAKNDLSQCLDVIAHEFTHCVTGSVMTYNSYMNDYGAINEAMSDIQGQNCELMAGDTDLENWILGDRSITPVRSMSDPHQFEQPEYTWDLYYQAKVDTPTPVNDHGGVHSNSSLLNRIYYLLLKSGGMTPDEARTFWFMVDCAMVPQTDCQQLTELLPLILRLAGMDRYSKTLSEALEDTRLGSSNMPSVMENDRALVTLRLPNTEAFDAGNWVMMLNSIDLPGLSHRVLELLPQFIAGDYSALPESVQEYLNAMKEAPEETEPVSSDLLTAALDALTEVLSETEEDAASPEPTPSPDSTAESRMLKDLQSWFASELRRYFFSSYGYAGQDGSTLNMIVRPGRTIPILMHATFSEVSDTPDQMAIAIYMNGKWYDLTALAEKADATPGEAAFSQEEIDAFLTEFYGEDMEQLMNIHSLEDVLDLFTVKIPGGEILTLSSEGLDRVIIPAPTPAEEQTYGTLEPGRKSRPKETPEAGQAF